MHISILDSCRVELQEVSKPLLSGVSWCVFNVFCFFFLGIKKLLEASGLPADQRRGCFQDGVVLLADSGLLQHPVVLIHPGPGRQQANSSISADGLNHLAVYAFQRLCKGKCVFSPVCTFSTCSEILIGGRDATLHKLNQNLRFSIQAASSLKQHESLRPCRRCGSPAKHSAETRRAKCTSLSCLFDFCTQCQSAFHGSTPCRVVQPRSHFPVSKSTPPLIPGSARSKRSVKRLWPRRVSGCQRYSQKICLNVARSTLTLMHFLKYYWDNQPDSVIWLTLLPFLSNTQIIPKRKRTV